MGGWVTGCECECVCVCVCVCVCMCLCGFVFVFLQYIPYPPKLFAKLAHVYIAQPAFNRIW